MDSAEPPQAAMAADATLRALLSHLPSRAARRVSVSRADEVLALFTHHSVQSGNQLDGSSGPLAKPDHLRLLDSHRHAPASCAFYTARSGGAQSGRARRAPTVILL